MQDRASKFVKTEKRHYLTERVTKCGFNFQDSCHTSVKIGESCQWKLILEPLTCMLLQKKPKCQEKPTRSSELYLGRTMPTSDKRIPICGAQTYCLAAGFELSWCVLAHVAWHNDWSWGACGASRPRRREAGTSEFLFVLSYSVTCPTSSCDRFFGFSIHATFANC